MTSQVSDVRLHATSRVSLQTHACFTAVLNEDQVRKLLTTCETSLGHRLDGLRGSLHTHANRAAAIWELLVLDAVLKLGHVQYEQPIAGADSSRPDFRLDLGAARGVWIDATYLTERFVGNERRADLLRRRFGKEGSARGIPDARLWSRLDGDPTPAGFRRKLSKEQDLPRLFRDDRIRTFFDAIRASPNVPASCDLRPAYTVVLGYDPTGRTLSGGLVEEAPRTLDEDGIYRKLQEKAQQHRGVPGPYIVCVGSDRSPSLGRLRSPAGVSEQQAVNAALARWRHLSAAILVSVESQVVIFTGIERSARGRLYLNQRAKQPLTSSEVEALKRLNFNRWRYSRPHDPWKVPRDESSSRRHRGGQLVYKPLQNGNVEIEIPSWLVLEALGGPTNVIEELNLRDNDYVRRVLTGGWEIVNVRMVPGNVTRAEPARVLLELRPEIQVFDDDHQRRKLGGSSRRR